ncbi:MAG: hypothetical protein ACRERZ_00035, partial [Gammaproteobacteria bacterium]
TVAGSAKTFHGFISRDYTASFDASGQTIRMTGNLLAYPYRKDGSQAAAPSATKALPDETYHWDTRTRRFLPEKGYAQPKACIHTDWPSVK